LGELKRTPHRGEVVLFGCSVPVEVGQLGCECPDFALRFVALGFQGKGAYGVFFLYDGA
jgi:hypothetical protein